MTLVSVLKVEKAVAALAGAALLQVLEEGVVGGFAISNNLDVDLLLVLDVEDDVSVLLVLFDLLVGGLADVCYGYSGCLQFSFFNQSISLRCPTLPTVVSSVSL